MHSEQIENVSTYTLYRRGIELLADRDFAPAIEALSEAARRDPEKSSVREALGRAYFGVAQYERAAAEFEAVVETHPTNDYAQHCLGRALTESGERVRARHHLAMAVNLRPDRTDYLLHRRRVEA